MNRFNLVAIANIEHIKYEKGDVQGAIAQWQQSVKINSNAAEPQLAVFRGFVYYWRATTRLKHGTSRLTSG